jgi:DNA primase
MARYDDFIYQSFTVVSKSGDERLCRCKWHADETGKPNLYVNSVNGFFFCHRCGERGHLSKLNDGKALPGPSLNDIRKKLHVVNTVEKIRTYPQTWLAQFDYPHSYWTDQQIDGGRGFSEDVIKRFRLGYDPMTDRCTIPLRDSKGNLLGVIYRVLDGTKPKYWLPKGFRKANDLFGSWLVRSNNIKRVALVEGPLDAVACWDAKVPAMAIHGSKLSTDQAHLIKLLGIRSVVAMMDNDAAGIEAAVSVKEELDGVQISISQYSPNWFNTKGRPCKDPAELSPSRRRHLYLTAKPWYEFLQ